MLLELKCEANDKIKKESSGQCRCDKNFRFVVRSHQWLLPMFWKLFGDYGKQPQRRHMTQDDLCGCTTGTDLPTKQKIEQRLKQALRGELNLSENNCRNRRKANEVGY